MKKFTILLFVLFGLSVNAQKGSIKGIVHDADNQAMSFATAILHSTVDSSILNVEYTKDDGSFAFIELDPIDCFLKVVYVGIPDYESGPIAVKQGENIDLPLITMQKASNNLEEVTITAKRPLLEVRPDKLVFNVEGSINSSGSDGMELLRKAPGVVIDNNDNITMLGKSGVQIYIDGKPSPLTGDDLAQFLRSLQSDQIDAIEIITNPSAKYEAEGNAGIINIKLVRNENIGANSSLSGNIQQGYHLRGGLSYNGNYRTNSTNFYGTLGYYNGDNQNNIRLYREQFGNRLDQTNDQTYRWNNKSYRFGIDHYIGKKHTLGILVDGGYGTEGSVNYSRTAIGRLESPVIDSTLMADGTSESQKNRYNFNINYKYDNGSGTSLNIDGDAGFFNNDGSQYLPNIYLNADGDQTSSIINDIVTPTSIDIYTFKVDYETPALDGVLGIGGKVSSVNTDNTFELYDVVQGENVLDISQSNSFGYQERVLALYSSYSKTLSERFRMNVGLRLEQTHSDGDLTAMVPTNSEQVVRDYLNLFPSGGFTYTPNQKHNFQMNVSRRLQRPNYRDLNPFRYKLDELTFEKGNPFLNPQYAMNYQLSHTFNYRFTTSLSYSHTTDVITRFVDVEDAKSTFISWRNLSDQHHYSLNFAAPITIKSWWNTYTSITGFIMRNQADYGEGRVVNLENKTLNVYNQQTFSLPKEWNVELSGWYQSPSIWGGTFEMNKMFSIDLGVQKKFMNGLGSVKLSVSDIFQGQKFRGESTFGPLYMMIDGIEDSRRVRLNMTYRFGNQKIKGRDRKTGLEDEQSRIKSN